ncbi:MAG: LuxR C-terminal-related transcriptional regulator [Thiobacillus sp.]
MRQIVAWMLAQNHSRKDIATALDLSIETVASHVKRIYQTVGAASSHGLMLKLAD